MDKKNPNKPATARKVLNPAEAKALVTTWCNRASIGMVLAIFSVVGASQAYSHHNIRWLISSVLAIVLYLQTAFWCGVTALMTDARARRSRLKA